MLKVKKRPVAAQPVNEEETLDPRLQTFAKEARTYAKMLEQSRESTNAANRQKTALGKSYKNIITEFQLSDTDSINVDGVIFSYGTPEPREEVPVLELFKLYENGEINKNQLIACLEVNKAETIKYLGAAIYTKLAVRTPSKAAPSIRVTKTEETKRVVTILRSVQPDRKQKTKNVAASATIASSRIKLRKR